MSCYFEKVKKFKNVDITEPTRKTSDSAGYDIAVAEDTIIPSVYKSIIKMLISRITSDETTTSLSATKMASLAMLGVKDQDAWKRALLEDLPTIQDALTLDLDGMKALVKEAGLKLPLIPTGMKAYMQKNQYLQLNIRSSIPLNSYLMLANGSGIIDSDYVDNPDNEGHIYFQIINFSPFDILIRKGDIIGQGIFQTFDITVDDNAVELRQGGFGSTSAK